MQLDKIILLREPGRRADEKARENHWSISLDDTPSAPRWLLEIVWKNEGGLHSSTFLLAQDTDENEVRRPINPALFRELESRNGLPSATEEALRVFLADRTGSDSPTQAEVVNKLYELLRIRR